MAGGVGEETVRLSLGLGSWVVVPPGSYMSGTGTTRRKCRRFRARRWGPQDQSRLQVGNIFSQRSGSGSKGWRDEISRPGDGSQLVRVSKIDGVAVGSHSVPAMRLNVNRDSAHLKGTSPRALRRGCPRINTAAKQARHQRDQTSAVVGN